LSDGFVDKRDIREVTDDDLRQYKQIHLFAGIGGFPLGFKWAGMPDDFSIITGGFPCTDISNAGKRAGIDGEQSSLWYEMARLVRLVRPEYVVVENVAALLTRGMGTVLRGLAESGYDCEWDCLPACAFGAPHIRNRVFVLAHADGPRLPQFFGPAKECNDWPGLNRLHLPDDWGIGDPAETFIRRGVHGIPNRVHRIRALGNAIVPQITEWLGRRIMERRHNCA